MNPGFYTILAAQFLWPRPVCAADFNVLRTLTIAETA